MRDRDAMSMTEAAAALGVSLPTVRRMVAGGQLVAFRTPGGHLRFTVESVKAAKGESVSTPEARRGPSPALQNRRERVEELGLEAQELRAQRELDALRREQQQEEAERLAEAEALRQERKDQAHALKLDRKRGEREEAEERARRLAADAARAGRQRFISTWLEIGLKLVPPGVPPELRLEVVTRLKDFLQDCQLPELQVLQMVNATVADVLAPWNRDQEIAVIVKEACKALPAAAQGLPWSPTEWDLKAKQAVFRAIADLEDELCSLEQIRTAVRVAVRAVVDEYEAHRQAERKSQQKGSFLDHWLLYSELTQYVRELLREDTIELEPGERFEDVITGLETDSRKYLDQHLSGTETRDEFRKLLHEFVRAEFNL
jgi:excisionase family DNA binding protein